LPFPRLLKYLHTVSVAPFTHGPASRFQFDHIHPMPGLAIPELEWLKPDGYDELSKDVGHFFKSVVVKMYEHFDFVFSVRCPLWPEEAQEFVTRRRTEGGWPSVDLVRDIVQQGCHVVKVIMIIRRYSNTYKSSNLNQPVTRQQTI